MSLITRLEAAVRDLDQDDPLKQLLHEAAKEVTQLRTALEQAECTWLAATAPLAGAAGLQRLHAGLRLTGWKRLPPDIERQVAARASYCQVWQREDAPDDVIYIDVYAGDKPGEVRRFEVYRGLDDGVNIPAFIITMQAKSVWYAFAE